MAASRRIAVTGASGFVGRAVCALLEESGQEVVRIRSRSTDDGGFDVRTDWIDRKAIRTCSAVIHLAGAPIARRWGRQARHDILESRVDSTGLIARALAELRPSGGPSTFLCMSGVNRYGTVRSGTLTESSAVLEEGFLAQVTAGWEEAAAPAVEAGVRTVYLRTGMVLGKEGGPLRLMLPAFRFGLGGPIAGGAQMVSWITLPDLARLIVWALDQPGLAGPVNAVAPGPVTQRAFAVALASALGRPAFLPLPRWALAPLGSFARETLLSDLAVMPAKALSLGFTFNSPSIAGALRDCLRG